MNYLLLNLPKSYDIVTSLSEVVEESTLSLEFVKSKLLVVYHRKQENEEIRKGSDTFMLKRKPSNNNVNKDYSRF